MPIGQCGNASDSSGAIWWPGSDEYPLPYPTRIFFYYSYPTRIFFENFRVQGSIKILFSVQDYIDDSYFPRKVTIYKIDRFSKLSPSLRYENLCDKMINGIPATTQHNNYYTTGRAHVIRHPCFGDDDGD